MRSIRHLYGSNSFRKMEWAIDCRIFHFLLTPLDRNFSLFLINRRNIVSNPYTCCSWGIETSLCSSLFALTDTARHSCFAGNKNEAPFCKTFEVSIAADGSFFLLSQFFYRLYDYHRCWVVCQSERHNFNTLLKPFFTATNNFQYLTKKK